MADYIDREKVLKSIPSLKEDKTISLFGAIADMVCIICAAEKEDVAPVVHGEWLCAETDDEQFFLCSVCNDKEYWESNYCPNCGAKMDAEQEMRSCGNAPRLKDLLKGAEKNEQKATPGNEE